MRRLFVRTAAAAAVFAVASTTPLPPRSRRRASRSRPWSAISSVVASRPTASLASPPASSTSTADIGYGIEVGYTPNGNTWFELTYMRQSSDVNFEPDVGTCAATRSCNCTATISTNYIHAGARWEFGRRNIKPFIGGGLGVTIFDPVGVQHRSRQQHRLLDVASRSASATCSARGRRTSGSGIRGTFRGWWSFVPSGQYAAWCGYYGCYAVEESATVDAGRSLTGGLVISRSGSNSREMQEKPRALPGVSLVMGWAVRPHRTWFNRRLRGTRCPRRTTAGFLRRRGRQFVCRGGTRREAAPRAPTK